ncbi:4-aminobutyrate aminotransferase, mitochondrial [Platysternon megacephalum]|uniref:4-aminobutyrate aminotransferase, mitochondrial n=1 Tax=Platysternon megacephalum TaxID=55544 RepID=A0A4D9EDM8_9SAUR|nr:4-aminobutyrate aminotransferase, mitochondrial [Platysternon megacephalum]
MLLAVEGEYPHLASLSPFQVPGRRKRLDRRKERAKNKQPGREGREKAKQEEDEEGKAGGGRVDAINNIPAELQSLPVLHTRLLQVGLVLGTGTRVEQHLPGMCPPAPHACRAMAGSSTSSMRSHGRPLDSPSWGYGSLFQESRMVSQPEKQAENDNNNKPQEPRELLPCPLSLQNASLLPLLLPLAWK